MRRVFYGVLATVALAMAGQAAAVPVITSGGQAAADGSGLTTEVDGATVETFDDDGSGGFTQLSWTWETSDGPDGNIVQGQNPNIHEPPFENETYFYSVAKEVPGSANVQFGGEFNYLGLYWGSVDHYNTLHLLIDDSIAVTISGTDVINLFGLSAGSAGADGSAYVNIFTDDLYFTGARFETDQFAFEFDNLAIARVPEPGSLALIGAGIAAVGLMARRRRRQ